jgi:hypothetical protein
MAEIEGLSPFFYTGRDRAPLVVSLVREPHQAIAYARLANRV